MKFKISEKDKSSAQQYLDKKLKNDLDYLLHLSDLIKERLATKELRECKTAESLNKWCEAYLSDKQFTALRASLRKKSSRKLKPTFNLEIDKEAYYNLNDLAVHANMKVKDYLIAIIQKEYVEVKPPAVKLSKHR
jgi:hypothetical protein